MISQRQMGETAGWFTGIEIENTQFRGMPTIFFARLSALIRFIEGDYLFVDYRTTPHVFCAPMNPKFFDVPGSNMDYDVLYLAAMSLLQRGIKVTFELRADQAQAHGVTLLRTLSPDSFCALTAIEIPRHQLGGYAIKVIPTHCFAAEDYEGGVSVIPSGIFRDGYFEATQYQRGSVSKIEARDPVCSWVEYEDDKDGTDKINSKI